MRHYVNTALVPPGIKIRSSTVTQPPSTASKSSKTPSEPSHPQSTSNRSRNRNHILFEHYLLGWPGRGGLWFPGSRKGRCEDAEGASSVYVHSVVMNTHTTCDSKDHCSSKLSINFPDYGWKVALFTNLI